MSSMLFSGRKQIVRDLRPGAIIGDGDRKSWDSRGPMIWDNFSIFRTNCAILTSWIHARVVGSRVDVVTLRDQLVELRDALVDFPQRWQGIRQRRRTRALLCTLMLWCNGKGVFFRVENSFNFALLMNKIRSPDSYTRKLLCLFCRRIIILKENSLLRYRVNLWVSQTMLCHNQNLFLIVSCCFCSSASLQKF